eukprot:jgi/Pico_ML_1/54959/g91.t1
MPSSPMFSTLSTPLNGELRPMTCTSAVYTGPPSFLRFEESRNGSRRCNCFWQRSLVYEVVLSIGTDHSDSELVRQIFEGRRSCAGATRDSSSAMASTEYPAAHKLPVSAPALVPMTPCTSTFRLSITASKNPT